MVAHHDQLTRRHIELGPLASLRGVVDIGLRELHPVDPDTVVPDLQVVTRLPDHPLDVRLIGANRRIEDDDVAALRFVELIGEVADEQVFAVE